MNTLFIICSIVLIFFSGSVIKSLGWLQLNLNKTRSIKEPPTIIHPIVPSPETFELSPYTEITEPLPTTEDSWLTINRDGNLLRQYATALDTHWQKANNAVNQVIRKFENDHAHLINQQLQIYRRIYRSRKLLARFKELRGNKLSAKDIPDLFQVTIPPKPSYPTVQDLQRKYSVQPAAVSNALSKIIMTRDVSSPQKLVVAAIVGAAAAIKAKSNNSKLKRVLEISRGNISHYCMSLKTTVKILEETHPYLVATSGKLKQCETELIAMIDKMGAIDRKITKLDQVEPDIREYLRIFHLLLLKAEQHSKRRL